MRPSCLTALFAARRVAAEHDAAAAAAAAIAAEQRAADKSEQEQPLYTIWADNNLISLKRRSFSIASCKRPRDKAPLHRPHETHLWLLWSKAFPVLEDRRRDGSASVQQLLLQGQGLVAMHRPDLER